jgi:hypothetical protein
MESKEKNGKVTKKDNCNQHFNGLVRIKVIRLNNPQQQG